MRRMALNLLLLELYVVYVKYGMFWFSSSPAAAVYTHRLCPALLMDAVGL
jgi:hypothetical protein